MAFNGSGTFVRLYSWANDKLNNIKVRADRMDAEMDGMATGLSTCITKDGQTTITANLPMSNYRHTGVGNASARTDYAAAGQIQDGSLVWVDGGGTADAITATYSPAITALVDGMELRVRATAANATTTPTFSPNGLTARTITKLGGTALVAGEIVGDNHELILRYNLANTRWELLNPRGVDTSSSQTLSNKTLAAPAITGAMNFGTGSQIQADDSAGVGAPAISFDGDTDTGFYRIGANRIGVALGGTVGLDMIGAASAVNWFEYSNSATGSPPYFIAKGSDTNIDFRVEAKGTGVLRCESSYTNTSSGTPNVVISSSGQIQRSTVALNSASLLGAATYTTNTTLSTTIPADDTIPQNTEGTEIMTVAVTPSSASKTLIIMWNIQASLGTATSTLIAPLFVDSTANALAVAYERPGNNAFPVAIFGIHSLSAGSTSTRTYKVRLGADAGDVYPNGTAGASRLFGSISACSIRVFEI